MLHAGVLSVKRLYTMLEAGIVIPAMHFVPCAAALLLAGALILPKHPSTGLSWRLSNSDSIPGRCVVPWPSLRDM